MNSPNLYPNLYEAEQAGKIFKAEMAKQANAIAEGIITVDTAINICAVKAWSAGRQYQIDQQSERSGFIGKLKHAWRAHKWERASARNKRDRRTAGRSACLRTDG